MTTSQRVGPLSEAAFSKPGSTKAARRSAMKTFLNSPRVNWRKPS
jgi:hypothetical protein